MPASGRTLVDDCRVRRVSYEERADCGSPPLMYSLSDRGIRVL